MLHLSAIGKGWLLSLVGLFEHSDTTFVFLNKGEVNRSKWVPFFYLDPPLISTAAVLNNS